jgi:hypothetical protein
MQWKYGKIRLSFPMFQKKKHDELTISIPHSCLPRMVVSTSLDELFFKFLL